jgi:Tol biopolymer transport system component
MSFSDLMNDLAEHRMKPDLLAGPEVVRREGDILRVRRRRTSVLVAAAVASLAVAATFTVTHIPETAPEPARPPSLPDQITIFDENGHISYVDRDGSRQTVRAKNVDRFALSADGTRIAFITNDPSGRHLWVADADGGSRERLPAPCAGCEPGYGVAWSHDGSRLAYVAWGPDNRADQLRIRTMSTDQDRVLRLPRGLEPRGPEFSPDDQSLVVNVATDAGQYVATLDLAEKVPSPTRLTETYSQVQTPAWSDDGQTIYFTATTAGGNTGDVTARNDLYAIKVDGTGLRQVTHAVTGERFFGATPYEDEFLINRARGKEPWTVGWLSHDGSTFTPIKGADGKPLHGTGPQLQP